MSDEFSVDLASIKPNLNVENFRYEFRHPSITLYRANKLQQVYRHLMPWKWHYAGIGLWQKRAKS